MSIRSASPSDLDGIMVLEQHTFPTDAWSVDLMRAELTNEHSYYIVDEEAGTVVGYAGLRAPRGAKEGDIQTIALADGVRGTGRGRALLHTLLSEARRRRLREVFLEVRVDNPAALGLYLSEGFIEIGRRQGYYQADNVDAIVMRRDMRGDADATTASPGN